MLNSVQAQRALLFFYELLPASAWEGGKPRAAEVAAWLDEAQDFLPAETLTVIDALLGEGGDDYKGDIGQLLLKQLDQYEVLRAYVARAVNQACEDCAGPAPTILGAFLVAMAVFPLVPQAHNGDGRSLQIRWDPTEETADLADRLARLSEFIPKHVLEAACAPAFPARQASPWQMPSGTFLTVGA